MQLIQAANKMQNQYVLLLQNRFIMKVMLLVQQITEKKCIWFNV